jgi:hypothetical protein
MKSNFLGRVYTIYILTSSSLTCVAQSMYYHLKCKHKERFSISIHGLMVESRTRYHYKIRQVFYNLEKFVRYRIIDQNICRRVYTYN